SVVLRPWVDPRRRAQEVDRLVVLLRGGEDVGPREVAAGDLVLLLDPRAARADLRPQPVPQLAVVALATVGVGKREVGLSGALEEERQDRLLASEPEGRGVRRM